jgi:microcystin-dependent protein
LLKCFGGEGNRGRGFPDFTGRVGQSNAAGGMLLQTNRGDGARRSTALAGQTKPQGHESLTRNQMQFAE